MSDERRRQLFVDRRVQFALLLRATAYWFYCLLAVALMLGCWIVVTDRALSSGELWRQMWSTYAPALGASILALPLVLMDLIRLSNRFVGPMLRVRRAMRRLADGETVDRLKFRKGDFWYDYAQDFNRVLDRLYGSPERAAEDSPGRGNDANSTETRVAV
jgi:hypothetical protein